MPEDFAAILEDVRIRIKNQYDIYALGRGAERNVIEHLVRRILHGLGWRRTDIYNEPENYSEDGTRYYPDLVIKADDRPILVIECKKIGTDIGEDSNGLEQLREYLITFRCSLGIITDGAKWNLWKISGHKITEVWSLDISLHDITSCISMLMDIREGSASDLVSRIESRLRKESAFQPTWTRLLEDKDSQIHELAGLLKRLIDDKKYSPGTTEVEAEEYLARMYRYSPSIIAMPEPPDIDRSSEGEVLSDADVSEKMWLDDERFEINLAYEILTKTAEWLFQRGLLRREDCPISASSSSRSTKYLVHTEPRHKDGTSFKRGHSTSDGLWINTRYNKEDTIRHATRLLRRFAPETDIRVEG